MKPVRTLIVDDERLARLRLRELLEERDDVEILGECACGAEAVDAIREQDPDLVFLDVRMPDLDGFAVLEAVGPEAMPVVVFVTAFDDYALQAFEVHAVDYLLKPFEDERVGEALERAKVQIRHRDGEDLGKRLRALLAERDIDLERPDADAHPERFVVRTGGRTTFLHADEIDWVEADGSYVRLHVGEREHLLRETMTRLEARLPARRFLRIHRSTLVNVDRIKEVLHGERGDMHLRLDTGDELRVSQRHRERVRKGLGL